MTDEFVKRPENVKERFTRQMVEYCRAHRIDLTDEESTFITEMTLHIARRWGEVTTPQYRYLYNIYHRLLHE